MFKFINVLWFFGSLAKGIAKMLVHSAPAFKELKEANKRDQLITSLQKELQNDNDVHQKVHNADNSSSTNSN